MEFVREVSIKRPVSTNGLTFIALGIFAVVSVLIGFACVCGYHVGYRHAVLEAMKTEASEPQVVDPSDSAMWMSYGTDGSHDSWTAPRQPVTVVERDVVGFTVIDASDGRVIMEIPFKQPILVEHFRNSDGRGRLNWMDGPEYTRFLAPEEIVLYKHKHAPAETESVCDMGKVRICHSGESLCVSPEAAEIFRTHFDAHGICP